MILLRSPRFKNSFQGISAYFRFTPQEKIAAPSKLQIGIFIFILTASIALSLYKYNSFQLGTYMDDASYAVLARSLVFSDTYGLMNTPDQPEPTRYPFGFPLILSPFVWLFPSNPDTLKLGSLLATVLNATLIFWGWPYLSYQRTYGWGLLVATLYAVSPLVVGHTGMVMSEPAFTTLILTSLILTEKFLTRNDIRPFPILLTGMLMVFAIFTRTIGLVLLAAVILRILFISSDKSILWKKLFYLLAGGFVFLAGIILLTSVTFESLIPGEYMNQLANPDDWGQSQIEEAYLPRMGTAFFEYVQYHLRTAVLPIGGGSSELEFGRRFGIPNLPLFTGLLIGGVILLGSLSSFQKQGLVATVVMFEAMYFIAILIWPWRGARFLYPILPFLFYHLLWGVRVIVKQITRVKAIPPSIRVPAADLGVALVLIGLTSLFLYKGIFSQDNSLDHVRDLREGTAWLQQHSSQDALVMAQQPQGIYLYSNRSTIDFPSPERWKTSLEFENILRNQGVDYILVAPELAWHQDGQLTYDPFTSEVLLPILNELLENHVIETVYISEPDKVMVYQLLDR